MRARPVYFVHPAADFLLPGGGSLVLLAVAAAFFPADRTSLAIVIGFQLSWVINWPHFSATSWRLYATRENIRQYPLTALLVPWLVAGAAAAALASPEIVAPAFVKLFWIWSPFHFSGQTVGVTVLYLRRAGIEATRGERRVLGLAVFSTMFALLARAEAAPQTHDYFGIRYPSLGLPAWIDMAARVYTGVMAVALLACFARWRQRAGGRVPLIVLVPAAAQYGWFVLGGAWPAFTEFVPLFHSLQYLLVAWSLQLKERKDREGRAGSAGFVWGETARWYLLNVAGGAALFWVLPRVVERGAGVSLA
ncbi:MAG: hypothetical protein RLZZ15_2637, partial [Verrucomicrobiota bacterium]